MSIDPSEGHPAMDYDEHTRTYSGFLFLTKVTIVAVVLLLVFMAIFLT